MALQIKGKFVENAAIDGDKLELKVGQAIKQKKADGTTVEVIKVVEESGQVVVKANGQEIAFKSQVDGLSTQVATQTQSLIAAETAARIADVDAEEARALAAEGVLQSNIDAEETRALAAEAVLSAAITAGDASTLASAKAYVDDVIGVSSTVVAAFTSLATQMADEDATTGVITALGSVKTSLAAEVTRATTAESGLQAAIDAEEAARIAGDAAEATARTAAISEEATLRAAGDSSLQEQITTLDSDLAAAEAALSAAITAEQTARIADVEAEEARALAAEAVLQGQLNTLGAVAHYKEKFVLSAADLAAGYIEFAREAKSNSIVASVGRLMIHQGEGEDFTVSVVAGKTRMTFVGNLVYPSPEELGEGDVIYVKYMA